MSGGIASSKRLAEKSGAAPVVIERVERGIPEVRLGEIIERGGEVFVSGGDGAEIVVAIGERGSNLCFVGGGLLGGFGRGGKFACGFEGGGSGGAAAGVGLRFALIFLDALAREIFGDGHFFFGFVGASGLDEDAAEQIVRALNLIVIARGIGGEFDGFAEGGFGFDGPY